MLVYRECSAAQRRQQLLHSCHLLLPNSLSLQQLLLVLDGDILSGSLDVRNVAVAPE
jgi:hypothetical protein